MTALQPTTILIVDGVAQERKTYRQYLLEGANEVYTILEAKSIADGLALCRSHPVDGVLLNYCLPDGDGLQFLSTLTQYCLKACPPVILVADQGNETIAVRAIKSGAEDYLVKRHLTPDVLRCTLRTAIENAKLRCQLQHSEEQFYASVETMLDCYGIYTAIRNESGAIEDFRVEYVNAAACDNNQLSKEQQIGKRLCEILPAHRQSGLFAEYCQLVETGIPLVKNSLIYADQYGQHYLRKAFDIRATKLGDGFVASWRDVTEQTRMILSQQRQIERERLVNQVAQQIRESLDLNTILQTTVAEVRQMLQSDRAFIYRFNPDFSGVIVVESMGEGWNSILNEQVADTILMETNGAAYRQGHIQTIVDIYTAGLEDCHVALLERFQIRANLIVPILQKEMLWGLLVVSQCAAPRQWESEDIELLKHLTTQVGIALQQELTLQQRERQFTTLAEASPTAIFRFSATGDCVYVNSRWCEMTGRPALAALGTGWTEALHPDDRDYWVTAWQHWCRVPDQCSDQNEAFQHEARCVRPDGSIIWFFCQVLPEIDEQGRLTGYVGTLTDITDLKRTEAALHRSQALVQQQLAEIESIYQTAPVGLAILDTDLRYVRINQQLATSNGMSVEAHLGRSIRDVIPNLADQLEPILRQVLATGEPILGCEISGETASQPGVCRTWLESCFPLKQPDGTITGINAVIQDITEQKHAQQFLERKVATRTKDLQHVNQELQAIVEDLQVAQEELQALFDHALDAILIADDEGYYVDVNPAACALLSRSRQELLGTRIADYAESGGDFAAIWQQFLERGQMSGEIRLYCADGTVRDTEFAAVAHFVPHRHLSILRDVSDRKRAEGALRQSEQLYRNLVESQSEIIIRLDLDGNLLFANPAAGKTFGFQPDQFLGQSMLQFVHPDDLPDVMANMQALTSPPYRLTTMEQRGFTVNGIRWFQWEVSAIQDTAGQVIEVQGIGWDVTDRKQAEAALRDSEQRYHQILDSIADMVFVKDANSWLVWANKAFREYYGMTLTALQGLIDAPFNEPDYTLHYLQDDAWVFATGQTLEVLEEPVTRHDGVVRFFSTIKAPIYNNSGQVVMLVGVCRDITEAKRNEEVHKQAEEKIREQAALLNITADAILVRALDNQILFWNAGAEQLYGWTTDEAIGQYSHNLWTEVSSKQAEVLETVITQGYWQGELQKITKDHREITVQSRWTLMRDEINVPRSVLTVDTDITEQKRLEAQFYRAQRLESIGTLASGIAHDLNNVLTPILAIAQLLPHKLQPLSQQDQALLKMIEDSAKRGADLIKQILSFARGVEGNRTPLQIGSLLMDIRQVIQRTFPKSIELQGNFPVQRLWSVSADATQLHQVIMNLCVNARDAMPNGGTLTLSAHNMQLDERAASLHLDAREGAYLVITVADTGWGIPPEHLEQIFDPFFTTKEPGKGTGLGLSTVLGIVKNHGGFVMVSSTLSQGSQFQVYLPAIVEQETEVAVTPDLPNGNQEVVLIVDDEAIIRDTLQTLLERYGYNTLVAQNGIEAIDLYTQHQHRIDVVLMDIRMPSMDGLTAIRSLQRLNPYLKVIAASGLTLDKQLVGGDRTPIKAFLQKPYSVEDLLKTLRVVLQPSN